MNQYFKIIKPGIVFGNLISVIGGFFLASKGNVNYFLLFKILLGVFFIISSSCVFNNYIDFDIDEKMERTKNRVLVKKLLTLKVALMYAIFLGFLGLFFLFINFNMLVICLAIVGFFIYVVMYSLCLKRYSIYAILIGSLSGAIPPVIGYCSVRNKFDIGSCILLVIFMLWQVPHSYAIEIFRLKDYKIANIPVLPAIKGIAVTKKYITIYILLFMLAVYWLKLSNYVGYKYLCVMMIINVCWLYMSLKRHKSSHDNIWAQKLFIFSIIVIIILNIMISIDYIAID
ncbi:Protoheme IX farnesyltransferase [Candidatus Ecksteinia adelgidicola]|nr:Protoheme IX farnesyltransferase [Candidatus Ecksteinia adelgidicola]